MSVLCHAANRSENHSHLWPCFREHGLFSFYHGGVEKDSSQMRANDVTTKQRRYAHQHNHKTKTAVTAATVRRLGAHTGTLKSSESSIASEQQKINENFLSAFCVSASTLQQHRRYELSFNKWPKRSAEKNYLLVPNEIFSLGLDYREISLYTYLLRCENRETYQCYPSYKTIGKSIGKIGRAHV